jgi:hypothetical protein
LSVGKRICITDFIQTGQCLITTEETKKGTYNLLAKLVTWSANYFKLSTYRLVDVSFSYRYADFYFPILSQPAKVEEGM